MLSPLLQRIYNDIMAGVPPVSAISRRLSPAHVVALYMPSVDTALAIARQVSCTYAFIPQTDERFAEETKHSPRLYTYVATDINWPARRPDLIVYTPPGDAPLTYPPSTFVSPAIIIAEVGKLYKLTAHYQGAIAENCIFLEPK